MTTLQVAILAFVLENMETCFLLVEIVMCVGILTSPLILFAPKLFLLFTGNGDKNMPNEPETGAATPQMGGRQQ